MREKIVRRAILLFLFQCLTFVPPLAAIDSDVTTRTLSGLKGVYVVIEDLQPKIRQYAEKFGLGRNQVQRDVERQLKASRIAVLSREDWLITPGKPMLYISINTYDEQFKLAYGVAIELRQMVSMECHPDVKISASTWSTRVTGLVNIDGLGLVKENTGKMVNRFIEAYWSVNTKEAKK
jgi:hypothetical protein